ncbi:MAG: hypothetical protein GKR89_37440 [Candidatus Latescibacteria bacterium]|nr:hypothetical protein [Candidatus Latescibacterota bacterium]
MGDHAPQRPESLCRHGQESGTVSTSLIGLAGPNLERARFAFTEGPPCTTALVDLTPQLHPGC